MEFSETQEDNVLLRFELVFGLLSRVIVWSCYCKIFRRTDFDATSLFFDMSLFLVFLTYYLEISLVFGGVGFIISSKLF